MGKLARSRGLTKVEVLLLLGIAVCVGIMLFPSLQAAREHSRQLGCVNNMRKLGLAYTAYFDSYHYQLVASSGVTKDADGKIVAVDGWSWLVLLLPYLDETDQPEGASSVARSVYDRLDIDHGRPFVEPAGATGTPHADALATCLPGVLCPSFGDSPYADPITHTAAITNYRPLGATHIESLSVASANPMTPKFNRQPPPFGWTVWGRGPRHPDGCCFPGTNLANRDIQNGMSNTLFLVESLESQWARWTVGADAAVVGFPRNVEFERRRICGYTPQGYGEALAGKPEADATYWTYHTYLDWDYNLHPYEGADGVSPGQYGPSSNHPEVVNHLLMDGSCKSVIREVDITVYMTAIRGRSRWEFRPGQEVLETSSPRNDVSDRIGNDVHRQGQEEKPSP